MSSVWLLTTGDNSDGNELEIHGVYDKEAALTAKKEYEQPRTRPDGSTYIMRCDIEEWIVIKTPSERT